MRPAAVLTRIGPLTAIDKSYAGPSFGLDEPLTVEVVEAITTFMKEGGKLHRRFACDLLIRAVKVLKEEANIVDIKVCRRRCICFILQCVVDCGVVMKKKQPKMGRR